MAMLTACGGGSGSETTPPPNTQSTPPPSTETSTTTTISGKVTFDRVPHTLNSGLDYKKTIKRPIRGAIIEAVNASGDVLDKTVLSASGNYSLTVDANTNVRLQIKSQIVSDGEAKWDFSVTDNTQDNQIYALQGTLASTGQNGQQTRDLHAAHGWTGEKYEGARAAAPFAILDSVYSAVQTFLSVDPNIEFPPLELRWSVNNKTLLGSKAQGHIGTSAYFPEEAGGTIYILGEEGRDTDEFDQHVILHEWGHYFEHRMSRTDSIGGLHSLNDRLDARVAFSEGWSNALSAILTQDPIYRDSSGSKQASGFSFNLETSQISNPGWFNEASIGTIIYDVFDAKSDRSDDISVGLRPIYDVMTSAAYKDAPVFATIFALADGLRKEIPSYTNAINMLLDDQSISGNGPNGNGESNSGAIRSALPIYKEVSFNGASVLLCSVDDAGLHNKLGNREFIFLNLQDDQTLEMSLVKSTGDGERDPDFNIWQGNQLRHKAASSVKGQESYQGSLPAGQYVIEVFDFFNVNGTGSKRGDGCYSFSVRG